MTRFFKGLGALIVLMAVIVGIPAFLILVVGNPLPTGAQWHSIITLQPDYGNQILLTKVLPTIAWIAWALFAIPWLYELIVRATGRESAKRFWLIRGQQKAAAGLITAVAIMFAGTVSLASPSPAAAEPAVAHVATAPTAHLEPLQQAAPAAQLAADAPATQAPPTRPDLTHQVQEGDTLWGLAQTYLGDGEKYPEIAAASSRITQPDGQHLTDPNVIDVGWDVVIPGAGPVVPTAPAQPAAPSGTTPPGSGASQRGAASGVTDSSSAAQSGIGTNTGSAATTTPSTTEAGAPSPTASSEGQSRDTTGRHLATSTAHESEDADGPDFLVPLATAGGIVGLLAAGIVIALNRRRLRQRRRRQPGERIAMPGESAAEKELELRLVENTIGLEDIDNALRTLQVWAEDTNSPLPELLAVRVDGQEIALYLLKPYEKDLPAPFELGHTDRTAWIVRPGTATPPPRASVSPYPALTTIGTDAQGGVLLLDLEQIGALNIVGDTADVVRGMLNAMAVELTATPWADGIELTLVGIATGIAKSIDKYRVQHVEDVATLVRNLERDLQDRAEALATYGAHDVHEGRVKAAELEAWAPHIVILAEEPPADVRDQLNELVARTPRLGIATVTSGAAAEGGSTIVVDGPNEATYYAAGDLLPPLPFTPQTLLGDELGLIQELFDTTEHVAHPADIAVERQPIAAEPIADSSDDVDETEETVVGDTSVATPGEPVEVDAADEDVTMTVPDWPAPFIRLLGPVDAINLDTDAVPARTIEFFAYLRLATGQVSGMQIESDFYPDRYDPDAGNIRKMANRIRNAVGSDPQGNPILPKARHDTGYSLHPAIRTDWDLFCELIGDDLSRTSNENLVDAIRLVRGQPFDGPRRRGWWAWKSREAIEEMMKAKILDAAEELANRALMRGDLEQAHAAAVAAKAVDLKNEAGWRMEIRAALSVDDADAFNRIVDDMYARVGGGDPDFELDEATQQLVDAGEAKLASA